MYTKYKKEHAKLKTISNCKTLLGGEDVKINIWRKNKKQKKIPQKQVFSVKATELYLRG